MNKSQFIFILCEILVLVVLLTMLEVNKTNVVGLIILFGVYGYYVWNNNINPLVGKVIMIIIAYVLIVAAVGFFWNVSVEMPDVGSNLLLPQLDKLDLNNNNSNAVTIPVAKIDKPGSDKYTYSFSVFMKDEELNNPTKYKNRFLFYRYADSSHKIQKVNIGLRIGIPVAGEDPDSLFLAYTTTENEQTIIDRQINGKIPIGRWTTVVITVNKTLVDVYIDGKLLSDSFKIDNLKSPSETEPIHFGNMPAYLANFSYTPHVVQPTPSIVDYLSKTDGIVV
jgi:hypothetical protein